jgi:O-antigen/teichoic acid export membrane protein
LDAWAGFCSEIRRRSNLEISVSVPRYYRLAKEGSWVLLGQIASIIGALVLVRVLTEFIDPIQYGRIALGLTVAGLVDQAAMGGLSNGISRFYSVAAETGDYGGYLRASGRLIGYSTLVVLGVGAALFVGLFMLGYLEWVGLAAAALLFAVLSIYNSTLNGIQNAARQRPIVAFHGALDAWLKIALAVGAVLWLGNSATAVVLAYACSSLIVTISQFLFLRRLIPAAARAAGDGKVWSRRIWAYSWPFSIWGIFTWAQQSSDRWSLEALASTQDVGLYAVLFQLGYTPIAIATGMAVSFIGPILYQRSGDATSQIRNSGVHQLTRRIALSCVMLTLLAFLAALAWHQWIFGIAVAAEFRAVSYLLPWVVLAGGLFATGQMLALKLMSELKSAAMLQVKIVTAILGIAFNVYGAAVGGTKGITISALAFSAVYFLWMLSLSRSPSTSLSSNNGSHERST